MAQQEVARLFRAVQGDSDLRDRLNSAPNLDTFVKLAEHYGYHFTAEEWRTVTNFAVEEYKCELSEIPGI